MSYKLKQPKERRSSLACSNFPQLSADLWKPLYENRKLVSYFYDLDRFIFDDRFGTIIIFPINIRNSSLFYPILFLHHLFRRGLKHEFLDDM